MAITIAEVLQMSLDLIMERDQAMREKREMEQKVAVLEKRIAELQKGTVREPDKKQEGPVLTSMVPFKEAK